MNASRMLPLIAADKPDEVRRVARRILKLERVLHSAWRRAAQRQLAPAAAAHRKEAETRAAPGR